MPAGLRACLAILLLMTTGCAASGLHYSQEGIDVVHKHEKEQYRALKKDMWLHVRRLKKLDKQKHKLEFEEFEKKKKRLMQMFKTRADALNKSHLAERWMHQHLDDFEDNFMRGEDHVASSSPPPTGSMR
jgi:hypothetical protein|mmetsp:Transcript_29567/g.66912  ORF Transcript_29567/g.66912 Transcript_29567/m.66912 type:complete len:130 (-) Transcript_29567:240-629(-)